MLKANLELLRDGVLSEIDQARKNGEEIAKSLVADLVSKLKLAEYSELGPSVFDADVINRSSSISELAAELINRYEKRAAASAAAIIDVARRGVICPAHACADRASSNALVGSSLALVVFGLAI